MAVVPSVPRTQHKLPSPRIQRSPQGCSNKLCSENSVESCQTLDHSVQADEITEAKFPTVRHSQDSRGSKHASDEPAHNSLDSRGSTIAKSAAGLLPEDSSKPSSDHHSQVSRGTMKSGDGPSHTSLDPRGSIIVTSALIHQAEQNGASLAGL